MSNKNIHNKLYKLLLDSSLLRKNTRAEFKGLNINLLCVAIKIKIFT